MNKRPAAIVLLTLAFTAVTTGKAHADWPMTAANPQRTSHNSVEVRGNLNPVWYRVIDPYIDTITQVIAADNKIFVSTSKGLYAFDAASGNQLWVYGTEMPLGNAPTYFNGILYVGGYDHKIHAINASNGQLKSGWSFFEAGAGFDTNPLVVQDSFTNNQPLVLAGNRDGKFYALNSNTGTKVWEFTTGGPIHISASYKQGTLYFASDDMYAYALNVNDGTQLWKSGKFPGAGFEMYWPVIWTDTFPSSPTYNQDFVIYAGSLKAGRWACASLQGGCQIHTPNFEMFNNKPSCTMTTSQSYLWKSGTPTLTCDSIFDYYNNNTAKWGTQKPWWRVTFILNRTNGQEHPVYAPFNSSGYDGDNQGFHQPPVVGGDGVLYQRIGHQNAGNGGCSGWIAGWKFGTKYISLVSTEDAACDEPSAFTSGGNLIYYGEGSFNHEGFGIIDTANPQSGDWKFNSISHVNGSTDKYTALALHGKFGTTSGAYSYMDGFQNFSPVPYQGNLYVINGNVLYALNAAGTATQPLPLVQAPTQLAGPNLPVTKSDLQNKLYDEIQKMLTAGHIRPGFHTSGLTSQWMNGAYNYPIPGDNLTQYFKNPAETVTTLIRVLDYINQHPEATKLQTLITPVKNYLQSYYGPDAPYSFTEFASIGWRNGARREQFDDLPEFTAQLAVDYDVNYSIANKPRECIWAYNNLKIASPGTADCWMNDQAKSGFPPENFYAAWKYAQTFPGTATTIFTALQGKLSLAGVNNDMTDANLTKYPYILNQYLAGYRGYVELDKLVNNLTGISQSSKYTEYQRLLALRWTGYNKDPNFSTEENQFLGTLNAARNFMYLTPELGDLMRGNILAPAQATVDQYDILTPNWFVSKFHQSGPESYSQPLYDSPALFQARAYVLKEPFEELVKYLDVPAFERGDLFYIQNLVAALEAPTDPNYTPAPTAPPPLPGDLDGDGDLDFLDFTTLIGAFNTIPSFNLIGDPIINIFDFNYLLNQY